MLEARVGRGVPGGSWTWPRRDVEPRRSAVLGSVVAALFMPAAAQRLEWRNSSRATELAWRRCRGAASGSSRSCHAVSRGCHIGARARNGGAHGANGYLIASLTVGSRPRRRPPSIQRRVVHQPERRGQTGAVGLDSIGSPPASTVSAVVRLRSAGGRRQRRPPVEHPGPARTRDPQFPRLRISLHHGCQTCQNPAPRSRA